MRIGIRTSLTLLVIIAAVSLAPAAAQTSSTQAAPRPAAELALTYVYLHTNAPPSSCGCFSMNGGGASFALPVNHAISAIAEAGAVANSNVDSTGLDLTLSYYLVGGRYSLRRSTRFTPFAQLLLGATHASGALAPGQFGIGSSTAFAMAAGGGVDLNLTHHLAARLVQADYLLTTLSNRTNDHQNNIRVSTGVIFRFSIK